MNGLKRIQERLSLYFEQFCDIEFLARSFFSVLFWNIMALFGAVFIFVIVGYSLYFIGWIFVALLATFGIEFFGVFVTAFMIAVFVIFSAIGRNFPFFEKFFLWTATVRRKTRIE